MPLHFHRKNTLVYPMTEYPSRLFFFSFCHSEAMAFDAFFHCHFPRFSSPQSVLWDSCLYYKYHNRCPIFRASGLLPAANGTKLSPPRGRQFSHYSFVISKRVPFCPRSHGNPIHSLYYPQSVPIVS